MLSIKTISYSFRWLCKLNIRIAGKDNIDLILRFSGWIVTNYPDEGLQIFIEDAPEVMQLPRLKILDFLVKNNKSLVIPYLVLDFLQT